MIWKNSTMQVDLIVSVKNFFVTYYSLLTNMTERTPKHGKLAIVISNYVDVINRRKYTDNHFL